MARAAEAPRVEEERGMSRILIIEDNASFRDATALALREAGHEALIATTEEEGLAALAGASVQVALLDLGLPDPESGFRTLERLLAGCPRLPVVVITGEKDMGSHVRAMRDGAFDYVTKPVDLAKLETVVARAVALNATLQGSEQIGVATEADPGWTDAVAPSELVGESPVMRALFKSLGLLATSRANVLLRGESGTGKELAARTLHSFSPRAHEAFVGVNCAALPGTLIEAELFGYKRGAFTGAERDRVGKLEAAGEGTLFLDEVGDVPLTAQVKLLRVLQERCFERLGETDSRPFRARVIAATHRDLEAMVKAGEFREDLYFRLNVASVPLPALRERREDIPVLTRRILAEVSREIGRNLAGISSGGLDLLLAHDWPGNVRELRNAVTRAALRARGTVIQATDLELGAGAAPASRSDGEGVPGEPTDLFPTLDDVEREHIRRALARASGHRGRTCRLLGISRPTLVRKLRRYKIET
jgi:DNA-binding NtrC family response regulator